MSGLDEHWVNDPLDVGANKYSGNAPDGSQENAVRCQPLRERYYKCTLNTHLDKVRDKCQFWWEDYKECLFQKKLQKKLEAVDEMKEAKLKEVGYKRPFWGGHTAPIIIDSYSKPQWVGEPVAAEHEIGDKVNLGL